MTQEEFLNNFETLAEAPGAIEKLRTLILTLAIRGALSSATTGTPLVSSGIDDIAGPSDLRQPFELPPSWKWCRTGQVGELKLGRQRSPQNHTGPHMRPYLRVANVHEARIDTTDVLQMNFPPDEAERFELKTNDVLLNEGQSYELVGRPAIYRGEVPGACFQNTLIRFRPHSFATPEFSLVVFRAYMRNGRFRREAQQTTNIAHLSVGRLASIEFPLPPIHEQEAIVAKVDQLMALCDELEARQTKKRETGTKLTQSALDALTSAEGPEEFAKAWHRVADNFQVLLNTPESVEELRQAILDLALSGRLSLQETPWLERPLGELAEAITKGTTPTTLGFSFTTSGIRFVKVENVKHGAILRDSIKSFITHEAHEALRRSQLQAGDVLFSIAGTIGETCVVQKEDLPANTNQALAIIRVAPEILDPRFLRVQLDSFVAHQIKKRARGGAMNNVSLSDLRALNVRVPPLEEQKRIVAKVDQLMALCDTLETKLRDAEQGARRLAEAMVAEMVA
jgi:restriction endonuclease S subunit